MQAVRSKLQEPRRLLTAALPANAAVLQHIDVQTASQSLDFINLQTYNLHYAQPGRSLCPAQMYSMAKDEPSVSAAAGYLLSRNLPAQSILLGIPTFGTSFPGCDGPGQVYDPSSSQPIHYSRLPMTGRQEGIDRRRIAAYCAGGPDGFVAYDNPETVKEKADFCKQKGFGVSWLRLSRNGANHANITNRACFTLMLPRMQRTDREALHWLDLRRYILHDDGGGFRIPESKANEFFWQSRHICLYPQYRNDGGAREGGRGQLGLYMLYVAGHGSFSRVVGRWGLTRRGCPRRCTPSTKSKNVKIGS